MKHLRLIIFFLTIFTSSLIAQEERKVAVFDPVASVDNAIIEIVREEISSAIVNSKGYVALERRLINKVLEENKFQGSGLVGESQISEIGKVMGADYVFVTTISAISTNYYISCKLVEVKTAHIEMQSTGTTKYGTNDLTTTTQTIVSSMLASQTHLAQKNAKTEAEKVKEKVEKGAAEAKAKEEKEAADAWAEIEAAEARAKKEVAEVRVEIEAADARAEKEIADVKTEQKTALQSQPIPATTTYEGDFVVLGGAVFNNGIKIEKTQLMSIIDNSPDIKKRYLSGMKKSTTGMGLIIGGAALSLIGGGIGSLVKSEKIERDGNNIMQRKYNNWKTFALIGAVAGAGVVVWGIQLRSAGSNEVRSAVDAFSSERKKTQQGNSLNFELNTDGFGLSYNF